MYENTQMRSIYTVFGGSPHVRKDIGGSVFYNPVINKNIKGNSPSVGTSFFIDPFEPRSKMIFEYGGTTTVSVVVHVTEAPPPPPSDDEPIIGMWGAIGAIVLRSRRPG
jgi:hypothetical protein